MSTADLDPEETVERSPGDTSDGVVPRDVMFMILKNRRRRAVLRYLATSGEETTLDALARHIAAEENGIDERALSSSQRKRVYIGLYQAHLPKMDDAGVIEFDKHRGRIALRPPAAPLFRYLEEPRAGTGAPGYYLTVALAVGLLAGVETLTVATVPGLPMVTALSVSVAAIHCVHANLFGARLRASLDHAGGGVDRGGESHSEQR